MILAADWIAFHADRTPEKIALIDQHTGAQYTYAQLHERIGRLAGYLKDQWGVKAGDRLAILAKNSAEYFVFQFACVRLGAIMLPLNWRLAVPELVFIVSDAEALGIVYDNEFADRIPPLMEQTSLKFGLRIDLGENPQDDAPAYDKAIEQGGSEVVMDPQTSHDTPMTIMYTSGTTGRPKGVIITHGMTFWNVINISIPTGLSCNTVHYIVLPLFHTGGLNLYANPVFHWGGTNIVAREFDPAVALKTLSPEGAGVTHFFGVPAIYLFMSQ
ncbi:MAG: acid--CoA ligase, partial [Chloroflexi bacterium]